MRKSIIVLSLSILFGLFQSKAIAVQPSADAMAPTQQQLITLFNGNSNEGIWAGRPYLQYFGKDGSTDYQETGSRMTRGRWRVNQQGEYCSVWPPSPTEVCYQLLVDGDSVYWKSGDQFYAAKVVRGNLFKQ